MTLTKRSRRAGTSPRAVNVEDLRYLAQRRLPKVLFDYIDGGAEGEFTLRENCRAFQTVTFRPRQAVAISDCDLRISVLGTNLSIPVILGPVGYSRVIHPGGEPAAAHAAGEAGTIYVLSTISGHLLEDVKAASCGAVWYQLYLIGGRKVAEAAIERARIAGFSALMVTVDTPVPGMRERDVRNGLAELLSENILAKVRYLPQLLKHPKWLVSFLLDGGVGRLSNVVIPGRGPIRLLDYSRALASSSLSWEDLRWLRELWSGPIIIKGVTTGEDARRAIDSGAAALVVSNHGGRQLDGLPATLEALPEIVAAVNGRIEILLDGGIRRGADVIKAVCLGARAVLIGRAYAYGLAVGGVEGVARTLQILRADIDRTLKLLGCPSIERLDGSYLNVPRDWFDRIAQ